MKTGVLCIHGFTGGPYEVQPFADYLKNIQRLEQSLSLHYLVMVRTLELKNFTAEHWMMEAEIAFDNLQKEVDKVIVVGFSMGGVIAMYLANRYKVKNLVLLSAAAKYIYPYPTTSRYSRNS